MNNQEQQPVIILTQVVGGALTVAGAAERLRLSERQTKRLLAGFRRDGVVALAHGNRGRQPAHTIAPEVRQQVAALATGKYGGFNQVHLTEQLGDAARSPQTKGRVERLFGTLQDRLMRRKRPPACPTSSPISMIGSWSWRQKIVCHIVRFADFLPIYVTCGRPNLMVTTMAPTAQNVGRTFAKAVRDEHTVHEVWASSDRDRVDLWVCTAPITHDQELHLYGLEDVIYDRFEDADVQVHSRHADLYDTTDFVFQAPSGAELIYRAA